jgi:hypothetical protein
MQFSVVGGQDRRTGLWFGVFLAWSLKGRIYGRQGVMDGYKADGAMALLGETLSHFGLGRRIETAGHCRS